MKFLTPLRTTLLFLTFALSGLLSVYKIGTETEPNDLGQVFLINYSYSEGSSEYIEKNITSVLENSLSRLDGIADITSHSENGNGSIVLKFNKMSSQEIRKFEISSNIRQIYKNLPDRTSYPQISNAGIGNSLKHKQVLTYTLISKNEPSEINRIARNNILKNTASLTGIQKIEFTGQVRPHLVIEFNAELCATFGVNPKSIAGLLQDSFSEQSLGSYRTPDGEHVAIKLAAGNLELWDIEDITLQTDRGSAKIKDVAKVFFENTESKTYFRINGSNAINIYFSLRNGENIIYTANEVDKILNKIKIRFPKGYTLMKEKDETIILRKEIDENSYRLIISLITLSLFVSVAYRKRSYVFILVTGLLINLGVTLLICSLLQFNISRFTLIGISVSFGFMMDNAIIMLDHYTRNRNRRIVTSIIASSLIMIAPLATIFFLGGENFGIELRDFTKILAIGVFSSIFSSYALIPALIDLSGTAAYSLRSARSRGIYRQRNLYGSILNLMYKYKLAVLIILTLCFGLPLFLLPAELNEKTAFGKFYNRTLGSAIYQDEIKPVTDKWLGGSLKPFIEHIVQNSKQENSNNTEIIISIKQPIGSTAEQMNSVVLKIEHFLNLRRGISKFESQIYSGAAATVRVNFEKNTESTNLPITVKNELISYVDLIGGTEYSISGFGRGFSNSNVEETPTLQLLLKGYNYNQLKIQAEILKKKLALNKRVRKIDLNSNADGAAPQEFSFAIDNKALILNRSDKFEMMDAVTAYTQPQGPQMRLSIKESNYDVLLREAGSSSFNLYQFWNKPFFTRNRSTIKIKDLGYLTLEDAEIAINRKNRQYLRPISFQYLGPSEAAKEYLSNIIHDMRRQMPAGYSIQDDFGDGKPSSMYSPMFIIAVAFTVIFFITSIVFESIYQALYLIIIIPICSIGVFSGFNFLGASFDEGGFAALPLIIGMISSSVIYIIFDINKAKASQLFLSPAVVAKIMFHRSRTIILTNISACCGMVAIIINGTEGFWYSFAVSAISGFLFSLFILLFIFPILLFNNLPQMYGRPDQ